MTAAGWLNELSASLPLRRRRWIRERDARDNTAAATAELLRQLEVGVSADAVRSALELHPNPSSLSAVIDCLDEWGVSAKAVHTDLANLGRLERPALAHLRIADDTRFVVLREVGAQSVSYLDPRRGWQTCTPAEFSERWTRDLLLATLRAGAGDPQAASRLREQRLRRVRAAFLMLGAAALGVAGLHLAPALPAAPSLRWSAFAVLHALGLLASAVLVWLSTAPESGAALRLCRVRAGMSCQGALSSPAGKLAGWIPLADLGAASTSPEGSWRSPCSGRAGYPTWLLRWPPPGCSRFRTPPSPSTIRPACCEAGAGSAPSSRQW